MRFAILLSSGVAITALMAGSVMAQVNVVIEGRAGAQVQGMIAGSGTESFRIPVPAGNFVRIEVMQKGVDLAVGLRNPMGQTLMEADSANERYGPETVVAISETTGDYGLEIRNGDTFSGNYEIRVVELRPAASGDGELIAAHRNYAEGVQVLGKGTPDARRDAIAKLQMALGYFRPGGDRYMLGLTQYTLGVALGADGRFRDALAQYEDAAAVFRALSDPLMEAKALNNRGGALDVLGEPAQALESYRMALPAYVAGGDRRSQANTLNNVGIIERELADWQDALADLQQAFGLFREVGDQRLEAAVLSNMGDTYQRLGDTERGLSFLGQALPLRRASRDRRGEAVTLQELADVDIQLHRPAEALAYLDQAIAVARSLGDKRVQSMTLFKQGLADADLGKLDDAKSSLVEGLGVARAVQDREYAGQILEGLARVELQAGHPDQAIARSEEALTEFRAIGDQRWIAIALETDARAQSADNHPAEARRLIEEALTVSETARQGTDSEQLRASFLATREDAYSFYIDLLMRSGAEGAALEANERARARSLIEMLSESGAGLRAGVDPALLSRERAISEELNAKGSRLLPLQGTNNPRVAELTGEIRSLEAEYEDVQAEIRRGNPQYAELMRPKLLTVAEIESGLLDANTMLLEYSLGDERSYLWVVDKAGLKAFTLPPRARIEEQVRKALLLVKNRDDAALPAALRELSATILGPAEPLLGEKRLAIVPDGALQSLPFSMLPLADGQPLLVRHEVVMEPSASALAAVRRQVSGRKPAPKMLAVFADPVFGPDDPRAGGSGARPAPTDDSRILEQTVLEDTAEPGAGDAGRLKIPRLPFTAQEADRILSVARGDSNLRAVGFQASREIAVSGQLSDYRYLHFATHGYLDTERPSLSALVLAQIDAKGQAEDGFLRVDDIYNARLSADLAVLSACQTGLGQEVRGEGLMGLTRAFLYAGVPRVIVSLWNVNDRATAELMASLYKGLLKQGKQPAAALREAQLELRKTKRWESPYYWAAFVQHGEWE